MLSELVKQNISLCKYIYYIHCGLY